MNSRRSPGIEIAQIFLERAEFSHRPDFLELSTSTKPTDLLLEAEIETGVSPDEKRGLVRVTIRTSAENRAVYNFNVVMTALVREKEEVPNMPVQHYVTAVAPAMLVPFVRQVVADLTWRGRFGPVWLDPLNVKAMMEEDEEEPLPAPRR